MYHGRDILESILLGCNLNDIHNGLEEMVGMVAEVEGEYDEDVTS